MSSGSGARHGPSETSIVRWRERALDYVLWIGLAIAPAALLILLLISPSYVSPGVLLVLSVLFLGATALARARRMPHAVRAWGFLVIYLALTTTTLATRGLEGGGRLLLVALPLYATVLLGPRSGYVATLMSLGLYAAATFLAAGGHVGPPPVESDPSTAAQRWLVQGTVLVFVLGPLVILVNRFVDLLHQTLAAGRAAAARAAAAERERRRLERALLVAGEQERRAVGHRLHDGPCQQLAAALLRCNVAQDSLAARGSREEAAHLDAVAKLLDASMGEIHDLARGLSPTALSPSALPAALADLARRTSETGTVVCDLLYDPLARPEDPETASQLLRVAQEAVSNAVRHAHASLVEVEVARDGPGLRLQVRDDGVGPPPDGVREGMGMQIMRHRAELLGGSLSISPAAGGGTLVTCTVPPRPPDAGPRGDA